mgnify:FL=1
MPTDDVLRKLWRALVRVDEDRDTFGDAFLWMHHHPCPREEWEHRFVTRFYFMRKDRWEAASRLVPLDTSTRARPTNEETDDRKLEDAGEPWRETFIKELKDAIHKETHKKRQPKGKGKRRPQP